MGNFWVFARDWAKACPSLDCLSPRRNDFFREVFRKKISFLARFWFLYWGSVWIRLISS